MIIDIIGSGNVATHLQRALKSAGEDSQIVNSRTLESLRDNAGLYIISVSDSAIGEVARHIVATCKANTNAILAHTSGSIPLSAISGIWNNAGVFYPMQTFSADVELDYARIPFFIEGTDSEIVQQLMNTASSISDRVWEADSDKRRKLHIASVLCCNFVNHLWALADEFLEENNLDFEMMKPLIEETTRKISRIKPRDGQTGPAVRGDMAVVNSHLELLKRNPGVSKIYSTLSESIISFHTKHSAQ